MNYLQANRNHESGLVVVVGVTIGGVAIPVAGLTVPGEIVPVSRLGSGLIVIGGATIKFGPR